jgi:hypothetical protein
VHVGAAGRGGAEQWDLWLVAWSWGGSGLVWSPGCLFCSVLFYSAEGGRRESIMRERIRKTFVDVEERRTLVTT